MRRPRSHAVFSTSTPTSPMKKILFAVLSLTAASLAFAHDDASKDKAKCDANCTKECCSKDKACTDAKGCKDAEAKKDSKGAATTEKK